VAATLIFQIFIQRHFGSDLNMAEPSNTQPTQKVEDDFVVDPFKVVGMRSLFMSLASFILPRTNYLTIKTILACCTANFLHCYHELGKICQTCLCAFFNISQQARSITRSLLRDLDHNKSPRITLLR